MEENKPWYASKTIWLTLLGFASQMLVTFKVITPEQSAGLIEQGANFVTALSWFIAIILARTSTSTIGAPK